MNNLEIQSVQELLQILDKLQYQFGQGHRRQNSFIYRGMSNENWPLLPSIYRKYPEPQKSTVVNGSIDGNIYASNENEILAHFKKEAGGILPNISQKDDFSWLQYAQHYGIPTRLLDFTSNPLVSLYFCCKSESENNGSIWVINCTTFQCWSENEMFCHNLAEDCTRDAMIASIIHTMKGKSGYDEEELYKLKPVFFIPAYIDERMKAQFSRFLIWGDKDCSLEEMVAEQQYMQLSENDICVSVANDSRFLMKIVVNSEYKHEIMKQLDILGVNDKTMFPGLDGIGRYLENYYRTHPDDILEYF